MRNRVIVEIANAGCPVVRQIHYNALAYAGREALAKIFFYGQKVTPEIRAYVGNSALDSNFLKTTSISIQGSKLGNIELAEMEVIIPGQTLEDDWKLDKYNLKIEQIDANQDQSKQVKLRFFTGYVAKHYQVRSALLALKMKEQDKTNVYPYNFIDVNIELGHSGNTEKSKITFTWELHF